MYTSRAALACALIAGACATVWLLTDHRNPLERSIDSVEHSRSLTLYLHDSVANMRLQGSGRTPSQNWRRRFLNLLRGMPFDSEISACGFHPDVSVVTDSGTLQFCLHCSEYRLLPTKRVAEGHLGSRTAIMALFAEIYPDELRFKEEFSKPGRRDNPWVRGPGE